jgi:hypothetical protein
MRRMEYRVSASLFAWCLSELRGFDPLTIRLIARLLRRRWEHRDVRCESGRPMWGEAFIRIGGWETAFNSQLKNGLRAVKRGKFRASERKGVMS